MHMQPSNDVLQNEKIQSPEKENFHVHEAAAIEHNFVMRSLDPSKATAPS